MSHSGARGSPKASVVPSAKPGGTAALSSARAPAARSKAKALYSVQVGAFKRKPQARSAALAAAKRAPGLLAGKSTTALPTKSRSGTLYRAALSGLTLDQANAACRQLKKARQDCLVVRGL